MRCQRQPRDAGYRRLCTWISRPRPRAQGASAHTAPTSLPPAPAAHARCVCRHSETCRCNLPTYLLTRSTPCAAWRGPFSSTNLSQLLTCGVGGQAKSSRAGEGPVRSTPRTPRPASAQKEKGRRGEECDRHSAPAGLNFQWTGGSSLKPHGPGPVPANGVSAPRFSCVSSVSKDCFETCFTKHLKRVRTASLCAWLLISLPLLCRFRLFNEMSEKANQDDRFLEAT